MATREQTIKEKMEAFDEAYLRENATLLALTEEKREKYLADIIEKLCPEILRIIVIEKPIAQGLAAKQLLDALKEDAPALVSNFMWMLKPQYQLLIINTLKKLSKKET